MHNNFLTLERIEQARQRVNAFSSAFHTLIDLGEFLLAKKVMDKCEEARLALDYLIAARDEALAQEETT
jgi:hypothetical protein